MFRLIRAVATIGFVPFTILYAEPSGHNLVVLLGIGVWMPNVFYLVLADMQHFFETMVCFEKWCDSHIFPMLDGVADRMFFFADEPALPKKSLDIHVHHRVGTKQVCFDRCTCAPVSTPEKSPVLPARDTDDGSLLWWLRHYGNRRN